MFEQARASGLLLAALTLAPSASMLFSALRQRIPLRTSRALHPSGACLANLSTDSLVFMMPKHLDVFHHCLLYASTLLAAPTC